MPTIELDVKAPGLLDIFDGDAEIETPGQRLQVPGGARLASA